jgi:hypothetical protein
MQGADVISHEISEAKILSVQQSFDPPGLLLQPVPPHTPQYSVQQIVERLGPTPFIPFLQYGSGGKQ